MSQALALQGVSVRQAGRLTLEDVSLSVERGQVLGLVGPTGSGKTTLIRAALGLQPIAAGQVMLGGRPLATLGERERASLAGYLAQERRVAWNMPAWRIAALGAADRPPAEGEAIARECLAELEAEAIADRGVLEMSGGERARVLLARLLATGAPLLIADEPAAGLDPDAQFLTLERLRARAAAGAAVIVTLHDLTLAARACDRIAVLHRGRLLAHARPVDALNRDVLADVFGLEGMLMASPAGPLLAARRRT
ncbi:MAG: ABC transporter ATP-binding protein [Caulobacterales bacterium]